MAFLTHSESALNLQQLTKYRFSVLASLLVCMIAFCYGSPRSYDLLHSFVCLIRGWGRRHTGGRRKDLLTMLVDLYQVRSKKL